jgi:hypothetical protein
MSKTLLEENKWKKNKRKFVTFKAPCTNVHKCMNLYIRRLTKNHSKKSFNNFLFSIQFYSMWNFKISALLRLGDNKSKLRRIQIKFWLWFELWLLTCKNIWLQLSAIHLWKTEKIYEKNRKVFRKVKINLSRSYTDLRINRNIQSRKV